MATNDKRAYWINLYKTNPEEYKRRSRRAYWKKMQENHPEEFKAHQREQKLLEKNPEMSKQQAHKIISTQDRLFDQNQLSLF